MATPNLIQTGAIGTRHAAVGTLVRPPAGTALAPAPTGFAAVPWNLLWRIAALTVLTAVGWAQVIMPTAVTILAGSRLAYLAAVPVLMALIAIGSHERPQGVSDGEVDWILAGTVCGLGMILVFLAELRLPTLARLWHLHLVNIVMWLALAGIVLFGARRVAAQWRMWLFALVTVTPLPYLLIVGRLGGSAFAYSALTALMGAAAVFLAARHRQMVGRVIGAVCCAVAGVATAAAAASLPLVVSVLLSGAVIPVIGFVALTKREGARLIDPDILASPLPRRSPWSVAVLAAVAVLTMVLNGGAQAGASGTTLSQLTGQAAHVDADWPARMGLIPGRHFDFMSNYLGSDATFVRYPVPSQPGQAQVAIDVITSRSLGALESLADVVWYPHQAVPQYVQANVDIATIVNPRVVATDSSVTTDAEAQNWCAVTWVWATTAGFQRVFVVANQDPSSPATPPEPRALSLRAAVADPLLWIARQQANPDDVIDPSVAQRVRDVLARVAAAGSPTHG